MTKKFEGDSRKELIIPLSILLDKPTNGYLSIVTDKTNNTIKVEVYTNER